MKPNAFWGIFPILPWVLWIALVILLIMVTTASVDRALGW